ncbi:MAG: histidine kinase [Candidatus Sedimenticola sp. 20ELBAFRAG]
MSDSVSLPLYKTIGFRLGLYQGLMVVVIALVFAYVYYLKETEHLFADEARQLRLAVIGSAANLNIQFNQARNQLESVTNSPAMVKYRQTMASVVLEQEFITNQKQFQAMSLLSPDGSEVVRVVGGGAVAQGASYAEAEFFRKAKDAPNKVRFDVVDSWAGLEGPGLVAASRHIDYFDQDIGTVLAVQPLSSVSNKLSLMPRAGGVVLFLLDDDGEPVLQVPRGAFADEPGRSDIHSVGPPVESWKSAFQELITISGQEGFGARAMVGSSGWSVLAFLPESEFKKRYIPMILWMLPVTMGLVVGGIFVMVMVSRRYTRPLGALSSAVSTISRDKNLTRRINWSSNDEFGGLTRGFNQMLESLETKTGELADAREQLEMRVAKRTRQLAINELHLRALSNHLQSVTEDEKARVAREIHDELGGTLTALKMDSSWIRKVLQEEQVEVIEKTRSMDSLLDSAIGSIRRIVSELRPTILDDLGLQAAIEWYVGQFEQRCEIACDLRVGCWDIVENPKVKISLFRIIQEALTNVARHSGASSVEISCRERGDRILVSIRDNGKGITGEHISDLGSHGVRGMYERITMLGGSIRIRGRSGIGTVIHVLLPKGELIL